MRKYQDIIYHPIIFRSILPIDKVRETPENYFVCKLYSNQTLDRPKCHQSVIVSTKKIDYEIDTLARDLATVELSTSHLYDMRYNDGVVFKCGVVSCSVE